MVSPEVKSGSMQEESRELDKMAHVKGETPTPERPVSSESPDSASSEDTCSICLGHITDKCVTDSCLHSFCLLCLKEWAKQKAVCPLCKLSFTKIMYEIKSETEYKEWKVPPPEPPERNLGATYFQEFLDAERRRFFGYRTTPFPGASRLRNRYDAARRAAFVPDAIPSLPPHPRSTRYSLRGSTMFRLSVYLNNIWVQPLADITGRYRQTSPELYREQPALTHRLVPWVNRELAALVPSSRVGTVLTEVMDLIERHPINSREFQNAMRPHLGERTRHFIHEFYHFARSPYDMVGHDNAALYVPRYGNEFVNEFVSVASNSDDSDAVVEVDTVGNPVASTSSTDGNRGQTAPGNVVREEILTQGGSVVISSSESSDSERSPSQQASLDSSNFELTHNPECPPGVRRLIGRAVDFLASVNDGASTSRSEGQDSAVLRALCGNEGASSDNDDSDGCMIIEEVVPKVPTPEVIELDSDDELLHSQNHGNGVNSDLHCISKQKKLAGKSKPMLKRTNFAQPPSSQNVAQQDHSYCTEDGPAGIMPSSSGTNAKTHIPENSLRTKQSELSSDSDENEAREYSQYGASSTSLSSHRSLLRGKWESKNSYNRKRRSRDCSQDEISIKIGKRRCPGERKVLGSVPKKDLKCKVKSSLSRQNSCRQPVGANCSRSSYQPSVSIHSDESSESSDSAWSQMVARNAERNKVGHSSDSTWVPPSDKYDRATSSTSRHRQQDASSSSEESCSESRSSWYNDKYKKSKKASRKRKKKSKEKHKEAIKKSSKRKKHRKKSKSKKYNVSENSDSESSRHKKLRKSRYRKKHLSRESDSDSASSYVKYKRKTTVSVRRYRSRISSTSSDMFP